MAKTKFGYILGAIIACVVAVLNTVLFIVGHFPVFDSCIYGVLVLITMWYVWGINTYHDGKVVKIMFTALLVVMPLIVAFVSSTPLDETTDTIFMYSVVIAIAVFLISLLVASILRKTGKLSKYRNAFVYLRILLVVGVLAVYIFKTYYNPDGFLPIGESRFDFDEMATDECIWITLVVFIVRALLGTRTIRSFNVNVDAGAVAYCRKSIRQILTDGVYLSVGMFMIMSLLLFIAFLAFIIFFGIIGAILNNIGNHLEKQSRKKEYDPNEFDSDWGI